MEDRTRAVVEIGVRRVHLYQLFDFRSKGKDKHGPGIAKSMEVRRRHCRYRTRLSPPFSSFPHILPALLFIALLTRQSLISIKGGLRIYPKVF